MAEDKKNKEDEGEKKEGEAEAPKKSKKKLIVIILVVLLLAGGGVASMTLMGGKSAEDADGASEEEDKAHEEEEHLERVELDTFIVNLSENGSFLKVKIALEANSAALHGEHKGAKAEGGGHGEGDKGGLPGVLGEREPILKDAIIRVLSSKTVTEVLSLDGKEALKENLLDAINEACATDEPVVSAVYFTDFIIQ